MAARWHVPRPPQIPPPMWPLGSGTGRSSQRLVACDSQNLFERGGARAHLFPTGCAEWRHTLRLRERADLGERSALDDALTQLLAHRHQFVETSASAVTRAGAIVAAAPAPESRLGNVGH